MKDDLSSAINEASQTLDKESARAAPRQRRKPRPHLRATILGILLGVSWVIYGDQAMQGSALVSRVEVEQGVDAILGDSAASIEAFYQREGVLPEAPPHSYLGYLIHYEITGERSYLLSYSLDDVDITHSYEVR